MTTNAVVRRLAAWFFDPRLDLIAVDADDTLWHDGRYYARLEQTFIDTCIATNLTRHDARNLIAKIDRMGTFGETAYAEALMAAARDVGAPDAAFSTLLDACRAFIDHDVEALPLLQEALDAMRPTRIAIVTKGDREKQLSKLHRANLSHLLPNVLVLSEKTTASWLGAYSSLNVNPSNSVVIGNNLDDDVTPALTLGARAVWFNHPENPFANGNVTPADAFCVVDGWSSVLAALKVARGH